MSTLKMVKKGLTNITAPQLIGADYGTRGKEFWMLNGPGGIDYKFTYTGHSSSLKAYEGCAPLTAIINKKAQAFINGKTWILNKKGKAKEKESTSEIARKVRALMANPNPLQSQKEFEAQQYIYQQIFGFCIMLVIKPAGFTNIEAERLWNIPPSMLDIEETQKSYLLAKDKTDVIKKIVINFGGERKEISANDVYIIKDFTPSFSSPVFPESRIKSLKDQVNNIMGSYESRGVLIHNRGALGVISPDGGKDGGGISLPLKEDDKLELQNDFLKYGLLMKQWKFIISSAAVKWSQIGFPTRDLMLFEEIEDDIMRLCDGYGYQYELMASLKGVTFANKNEAKKLLYQDTIIPEAESICEQWDTFFELGKYDLIIVKDFSKIPALQQDQQQLAQARKTRNEAMQIEFYNNLCTLNDWRVANGDDPLTEGEMAQFGPMYYFQLIALGWKFGSSGATLRVSTEDSEQTSNNNSSTQNTEEGK